MKRLLAYAACWIGLALCIGALVGSLNIPKLYALATGGVRTQGSVLALKPANHRTVRYAYQVAGVTYEGAGTLGAGNPAFGSLTPGSPVLVHYVATNPGTSILGEPGPRLENEVSSVAMAMLVLPSLLILALVLARRRQGQ
jgi:hypothetical protein